MSTNNNASLRSRALGLLARREHSRVELQRKLCPHTQDAQELIDLLDDFTRRGWLSDARFAEALVHDKQAKFGTSRLAYELRERGVEESIIRDQLAELKDTELERARQVWQSKFGVFPEDAKARAKQSRIKREALKKETDTASKDRLTKLEKELANLKRFARCILLEIFDGYDDWDYIKIQDIAIGLGLAIKTKYDPAVHGRSDYYETGDDWYVLAPFLEPEE